MPASCAAWTPRATAASSLAISTGERRGGGGCAAFWRREGGGGSWAIPPGKGRGGGGPRSWVGRKSDSDPRGKTSRGKYAPPPQCPSSYPSTTFACRTAATASASARKRSNSFVLAVFAPR